MSQAAAPAPLPPEAVLFQLGFGKIISYCVGAVSRVGVTDHMSDTPMTVEEIAAASGTHAPSLYRVLRMLSAFGVFAESPGRKFALTPAGRLLRSGEARSMRSLMIMLTDQWSGEADRHLDHCLRTGVDGVTAAYGKNLFDLFPEIPEQAATFHKSMTEFSASATEALLPVMDFSGFRRLADVGGGHGYMLRTILAKFPNLQGVLFDLPEVASGAPAAERLSVESGSFFETVPAGCDAYISKHIIHDWSDEHCRRILSLMRDGLAKTAPQTGRVFLAEMLITDTPEPTPAKLLDIEMLVATEGGKERSEQEFAELFASAGLQLVSIKPTKSPICLIEARLA